MKKLRKPKLRIRMRRRTVLGVTALGVAAGVAVAVSKGRPGSTEDEVQPGGHTETAPSGKETARGV